MQSGWIKWFSNNQSIYSDDRKPTSWLKTSLNSIVAVAIIHPPYKIVLNNGPGNYHYSEDWTESIIDSSLTLCARRIEFQLEDYTWLIKEIDLDNKIVKEYISKEKV